MDEDTFDQDAFDYLAATCFVHNYSEKFQDFMKRKVPYILHCRNERGLSSMSCS